MSLDSSPIWPPFEAFYIQSMLFNSQSAMRSIGRLHTMFEKLPEHVTAEDLAKLPTTAVLNELHNMVTQGAALSRYFWPVRKKKSHEDRGAALRDAFSMDESSVLFSRDLRNAMEHFDERLDDHVASGVVGYIFPEYVGPAVDGDGVPGHFFRAYFVDKAVFRLLNEDFPIDPLAAELEFVHAHLLSMDRSGGRLKKASRDDWDKASREARSSARTE